MAKERRGSDLVRRQDSSQPCALGVQKDFTDSSDLLQGCQPLNTECLCAQNGTTTFASWYLDGICRRCDAGSGAKIDPLKALGELCPDGAAARSDFTCPFFTSTQVPTSSPLILNLPPVTTTTPTIIHPSISSKQTAPTATRLSSSSRTLNSISNASAFSSQTTKSIGFSHTTTATLDPASVTDIPQPNSITSQKSSGGLSTGAKAGIGVAAGVGSLILVLAILFFFCRRRNRKTGWSAKGVNARELYGDEGGVQSAYALNGGAHYIESPVSPIGTAITTENKAQLGAAAFAPHVREVYMDEDDSNSPSSPNEQGVNPNARPASDAYYNDHPQRGVPPSSYPASDSYFNDHPQQGTPPASSRPASQNAIRTLNPDNSRPASTALSTSPTIKTSISIPRKEIGMSTSMPPSAHSNPSNNHAIYTPSPTQSRSESRLRGPVPDMYAFGGEEIENDEELERLEEEERRIDDAIRESERLERMREEREVVRRRIEERRAGGDA